MGNILNTLWYEKYRAKEIDDLILPQEYKENFDKYIKEKMIPHLLFFGPAGSGKTTIAMILIKYCASASLILNASSNDRGIATIKTKVKQFAASKKMDANKSNIILLDEADGLTNDAQFALKNTIETYHKNCRFILTANEYDKIIEPIASRCILFKFDSLHNVKILKFLISILEKEKIEYEKEDLRILIAHFAPDMRTIINNLQAGSISGHFKIKNTLSTFDVEKIKELILKGDIGALRKLWAGQTDFVWLYKHLFNVFLEELPEKYAKKRMDLSFNIADYLYKNSIVVDKEINITAAILEIMNTLDIQVKF